jgi:deoxyribodipyrimidine photo-lyase
MNKILVWLYQDLRLLDNPALYHAAQAGEVIPVYVLDQTIPKNYSLGGAQSWWLHNALENLRASFSKYGVNLILANGKASEAIARLAREFNVSTVYWNEAYEPHFRSEADLLEKNLPKLDIGFKKFHSYLLFEQEKVVNSSGSFFKIFTPFWRHCLTKLEPPSSCLPLPKFINSTVRYKSDRLTDWELYHSKFNWAKGLEDRWEVSEGAVYKLLTEFIENKLENYAAGRDIPAFDYCSNLSPYLHFGMVSVKRVWKNVINLSKAKTINTTKFLSELGWREFSYHILCNFPQVYERPYRAEFEQFPWSYNEKYLIAWQRGKTGIPIVDAGMRELWQTGFMHNRVRMIVASFLTKNLLIDWRKGAEWFWDTLVDADLASNSMNWQWVAGSGTDASPYFRIFNPVLQGKKFDPEGHYVKKYVPELAEVPPQFIHNPWDLKISLIPKHYSKPILDLNVTRKHALQAYKRMLINASRF